MSRSIKQKSKLNKDNNLCTLKMQFLNENLKLCPNLSGVFWKKIFAPENNICIGRLTITENHVSVLLLNCFIFQTCWRSGHSISARFKSKFFCNLSKTLTLFAEAFPGGFSGVFRCSDKRLELQFRQSSVVLIYLFLFWTTTISGYSYNIPLT